MIHETVVIETPTVLYDVYYLEDQDAPSIQCRVKAFDLDQVIDYVKKRYSAYEYEGEDGEEENLYLTLNRCKMCDNWNIKKDKPRKRGLCDMCELSACFELRLLEEDTPETLKLIIDDMGRFTPWGYESFIDLTVEEV